MASKDELEARIDHLLRENAAIREASDELVKEAARLRKEIDKHQAKQEKKPRIKRK